MRILVTSNLDEQQLNRLRRVAPEAEFVVTGDAGDWDREYSQADIVFGRGATAERLRGAVNLKWLQVWSAGVDRYMFPELVESDIVLTNMRGMHGATIADHVMMFALILSRNFTRLYSAQIRGEWARRTPAQELEGTTMGIIGLGGIGTQIAERARGFGQSVLAVRRHPQPHPSAEAVYAPGQLHRVLATSDFVVVSCPLTPETTGLIGPEELGVMKPQAYLINIARGKTVNQGALIAALREGVIAGAALDVFEEEPLPEDSPLWGMENVIITPHMAGAQCNYMERALDIFVDNLQRYIEGRPLRNVVDKRLGY